MPLKLNEEQKKRKADVFSELETGKVSISNETSNLNNIVWEPSSSELNSSDKKKNFSKLRVKEKPADVPLSKPVSKRISRALAYEDVVVDSNKWEGLVQARRCAEQLHFPLQNIDTRPISTFKAKKPRLKSDFQKKVAKLIYKDEEPPEIEETEEEKAQKKALCLKDAQQRSRESWRAKILRQRYERKMFLRNKSKGRKHHRIIKREKLREERRRIELLMNEDPAAALEAIKEMDRLRIEERMTLRHKTSQWLKFQGPRVKRDSNIRETLKENEKVREELLEKINSSVLNTEDLEDDEDADMADYEESKEEADVDKEEIDFLKEFQKQMDKMREETLMRLRESGKSVSATKQAPSSSQTKKQSANEFEFMIDDMEDIEDKAIHTNGKPKKNKQKEHSTDTEVDISDMKKASENLVDDVPSEEEDDEESRVPNSCFENALAMSDEESNDEKDDTVENNLDETLIKDFRAAKEKAIAQNKPKLPDNFIPGWGTWYGADVKRRIKKKNSKRINWPDVKKKTSKLGKTIYRHEADVNPSLRSQMVKEVPYPFKSVADYEASVRYPLLKQSLPVADFQKIIKPKVQTKLGHVIKPITDDMLVKKHIQVKKQEAQKIKRIRHQRSKK